MFVPLTTRAGAPLLINLDHVERISPLSWYDHEDDDLPHNGAKLWLMRPDGTVPCDVRESFSNLSLLLVMSGAQ